MASETKTVLLVEDDEIVRGVLFSLLEISGYRVLAAADGFEALRKLDDSPGKLDLLVSDIRMPGMSGIELAAKVELRSPSTRILLISGFALDDLILDERWEFLRKPFLPAELIRKTEAMLLARSAAHGD